MSVIGRGNFAASIAYLPFYGLDRQSELTLRKAISELEARYQP
jgi:hypothetical protein